MAESQFDSAGYQEGLTLTERELFDRLGWFTQIRWVMGLFSLLMLLAGWSLFGILFRVGTDEASLLPAARVVLLIFLYNAVFTFLLHLARSRRRITRRTIILIALGQIACDMLAVFGLVHYTGGVENFFVILMLLPLVIAAEMLPRKLAYVTAAGGAVLTNFLAWAEQQGVLPHARAERIDNPGVPVFAELHADPIYVLKATVALTAMMFAIVFIGSTIAKRLRMREAELERAYRRLHRVDEAKGFFMRKAGHEMRAPLAAIYSILDAITHAAADMPESHLRLIERAKGRTRALTELVGDLRRYSWLRSPEGLLANQGVCLEELVENTVELFRKQAEAAGAMITCRTDPVQLVGDEQMLREVVTNLVTNAIQYTPAGGRIDVELAAGDGEAVLTVADTGIGISEQARGRVFEEFYRAPEAKERFRDGTGLGLSITRRIVTMHGGRIDVAPRGGGGTVFTVTLPARRDDEAEEA